MSREKHGCYDEQSGLPDNAGQAVGDGSQVWLMSVVEKRWPDLAEAARQRQGNRYSWLAGELHALGDDEATAIADEYRRKLSIVQRGKAQQERRRQLAQYEELARAASGVQLAYIEKCIAKLRKQIDKAEQRKANEEH